MNIPPPFALGPLPYGTPLVSHGNHSAARWGKVSDGLRKNLCTFAHTDAAGTKILPCRIGSLVPCDRTGAAQIYQRDVVMSSSKQSEKMVSVRFSAEEMNLLEESRTIVVNGVEITVPLATLIRQLTVAGCKRMKNE